MNAILKALIESYLKAKKEIKGRFILEDEFEVDFVIRRLR